MLRQFQMSESEERADRPAVVRLGAVSYLNSRPLIEDIESLLPGSQIQLDYPSRLADALAAGDLDIALIPSIEYFRRPGYEIVSNALRRCAWRGDERQTLLPRPPGTDPSRGPGRRVTNERNAVESHPRRTLRGIPRIRTIVDGIDDQ